MDVQKDNRELRHGGFDGGQSARSSLGAIVPIMSALRPCEICFPANISAGAHGSVIRYVRDQGFWQEWRGVRNQVIRMAAIQRFSWPMIGGRGIGATPATSVK